MSQRVVTDRDGRFVLRGLTRGEHSLRAELPGAPVTKAVTVRSADRDAEIVVSPGAALAGQVALLTGTPVPWAVVDVYSLDEARGSRRHERAAISDAAGRFEIAALAGGVYGVEVTGGDGLVGSLSAISVEAGAARRNLWVAMHPGVRVRGRLSTGVGQAGDGAVCMASVHVERETRPLPGVVAEDGTFEISGLVPGARAVVVCCASGRRTRRLLVELGDAQVIELGDVRLEPGDNGGRGKIGISLDRWRPEGVVVAEVLDGGPAAKAGVTPGDRITHVDREDVALTDRRGVMELLRGAPGSTVTLRIVRGSRVLSIPVTRE